MSDDIAPPDWLTAFNDIAARGSNGVLDWGLPEAWVQTELYAWFTSNSDWQPFYTEAPYLTCFPVSLPKNRDWKNLGAFKWIDLCLRNDDNWLWFELKVRQTESESSEREEVAAKSSVDALAKDFVGLNGFDADGTATAWQEPDSYTKAYWIEKDLAPLADSVRNGKHTIVSAYLHINGTTQLINKQAISERISTWYATRSKAVIYPIDAIEPNIEHHQIGGGIHNLWICEATVRRKNV